MTVSYDGEKGEERKKCLEDEDEEADVPVPRHPTPPDGGWGWWVVLSSFLCNMIVDGVCISFGVVTVEYQKVFNSSHAMVGWVGSSLAGCYLLVGPFVSALCARYGCRKVTMMGSVITMLGFALSTQSKSIEVLIITYGIIGGIGFGMIYLPSIVCVGHWFDKKRAFTTGIVVSGTGMGQFVFPPIASYLLTEYGWEGKNLIMAGIVLHCAVCGMTFLPLDRSFFKRNKRFKNRVEIERGAIMKALIEDKKRQRTISNGSLDNCVITRDNRLIRLDPRLLECKRNNSFIARFKRQLGFSSQSLACSKNSLQGLPSIVIDAVQQDFIKASGSPIYRPKGGKLHESHSHSQLLQKSSPVVSSDSSLLSNGVTKTSIPDVVVKDDTTWLKSLDEGITFTVTGISGMPSVTRSTSDLETSSIPSPLVQGSVISIQVIENNNTPDALRKSVRYRSGVTISTGYSSQVSEDSFASDSQLSAPQINASIDEVEFEMGRHHSIAWKCWQVLLEMFDIKLLLNPMFALLVISSFVTLLAFYIPFFHLPNKGVIVGMSEPAAAFLLSIVGITNTLGRVICGWLADRPWVNTLHFNNGALILAGVVMLMCPLCEGEAGLAIVAAILGVCMAVFVSLRSVLLVDLLGLEMLTKSFGLLILFQGIAAFIGAPIAGELIDTTGDINDCFYLAGGLTILSGLIMLPISCLKKADSGKSIPAMPRDTPINEILRLENIG
ncbi:unnamed protein product [Candidula unifasciata]|uniref:Major facilitator superfamily (MFS) profile domain-containing protein n=1 Tax=Candidula unifasciata TaxID=100452 RepID=A0A8S3Z4H7_9EUPU|nr:unnamed protein product [Candidula unifasciata]